MDYFKNDWYKTLNKSQYTPPSKVFSIVWIILYSLMAYSYYTLYKQNGYVDSIFYYQLIINISWIYVFFSLHDITLSLILLGILIILVFIMYNKFKKENKLIGNLQLPYLLWLCIAFYLNFYIYQNN